MPTKTQRRSKKKKKKKKKEKRGGEWRLIRGSILGGP